MLNLRRNPRDHPESSAKLLGLALAVLSIVIVSGTIGYLVLGLGLLDAVYQTVITVSTVGYREVGDDVGTGYLIFTIVLILTGVGSVLFFLGVVLEILVEGRLTDEFWRRRMDQTIERLRDHTIVCGYGQVGRAIATALRLEGTDVVIVDRNPGVVDPRENLFVVGDATEDAVLREGGIEHAKALVSAVDTAADNVYVSLTARSLNADLFIVARATASGTEARLHKAGADRVVNPHERGGAHMAALVSQPNVAEFLGEAMHERELAVRLGEVTVTEASPLAGQRLDRCDLAGAIVVATRSNEGFVHHPDLKTVVEPGDVLIVLGTEEELSSLRERAARAQPT